MQKLLTYAPHTILSKPAKHVVKIDSKIKQLIKDMKNTLENARNPRGVGLAAVQIGQPYQIFIMKPSDNNPMTVHINPKITWRSSTQTSKKGNTKNRSKKHPALEGCLSIHAIWGQVKRCKKVKLTYLDESGTMHENVEFSGFPAHIVQHEIDHLNGILFTQRVLEQKGKLYKPGKNEKGEEVLEPFSI